MGSEDLIGKAPAARPEDAGQGCPVLDPAALERLAELDPSGSGALVARVLRAFQSSADRLYAQYSTARASGDHAALRLVAHTLKSSSASIGAMHLSQLSARIETMLRVGDVDELAPMLNAFDDALDQVLAEIAYRLRESA